MSFRELSIPFPLNFSLTEFKIEIKFLEPTLR